MCGFVVAIRKNLQSPPINRNQIRTIRDAMLRRGPDASGEWFSDNGRIGMGHRRLSIIDLSETGAQPMRSSDGRFSVVFNGEIYNHRELRAILEGLGHSFRSTSDTEVLLHGYRQWGAQLLDRLRGMFAFALWDERRESLLIARDPYGIKPLYYTEQEGVFSSRPR
jgi:asparagine synthase (glutamine-hydrolysing)